MSIKKANSFLLTLLLFSCSIALSQPASQTFNPYSRFGIGEIENKGFAQLTAMGRATTAFDNDERDSINPVFLNPANPASYTSLRLTVFEAGGKSDFNFLESGNTKIFRNTAYLSYIALGVPLGKRAGFAAGITPFSSIGYSISDGNYDPYVGDTVTTLYEGSGGLNQVFVGLGYRPFQNNLSRFLKSRLYDSLRRTSQWDIIRKKRFYKGLLSSLSFGANAYLMFGDLNNTTSVMYPSSVTYFNTRRVRATRVSDFYSSYGLMFSFRVDSTSRRRACLVLDTAKGEYKTVYRKECSCRDTMNRAAYEAAFPVKLRKRKELKVTVGANVYMPAVLKADYSAVAYSYKPFGLNINFPYDTTLNVQRSGGITMPLITSFGVALRKGTKLTVLSDVSIQNWSYYRFFGDDPKLKNAIRYSLGFQYVSNEGWKTRREMMREKTMYRAGLFYNSGHLDLKQTRINEYGVSLGIGLPLGNYNIYSAIYQANVSVELGTRGTTQNNLVKNNFIRATLGLTLNQRWFVKRVID